MTKKKRIGIALVFLVIGVGLVHGQSISSRVSEYERTTSALVSVMNRIVGSSSFVRSDWNALEGLIRDHSNAFYVVYNQTDDGLDPYESRLEACRRSYRQAYNNLISWVNRNSDSIPKDSVRMAERIAENIR
jgi:hypothetical protein